MLTLFITYFTKNNNYYIFGGCMNLRMYNVRFGDCFLLSEEAEHLLIDFGSDTPSILNDVSKNIISTCQNKNVSVLFTHFHLDHINGILETNCMDHLDVRCVYMPNIFAMRNCRSKLNFLQIIILEDVFRNVFLNNGKRKITLFDLLMKLVNKRTNVNFLKRDDSFVFSSKKYDVLWPCFNEIKINKRFEDSLILFLSKIGMIDNLENQELSPQAKVRIKVVDELIEVLLKYYNDLSQKKDINVDMLSSDYKMLLERLNEFDSVFLQQKSQLKEKLNALIKLGNEISLVFQDQPQNKKSKILMTGDVKKHHLHKIINCKDAPQMSQEFEIIKAPHHATETHFIEYLPKNKVILASNGEPKKEHTRYGKVAYQYALYIDNMNTKMICTNPRCLLLETCLVHKCQNCSGKKNENELFIEYII